MPMTATEAQVSGHQRPKRSSADSSPVESLAAEEASRRSVKRMQIWTASPAGPSRRSGRSTQSLPSEDATADSPPLPTWVILNQAGARRGGFPGNRTTSATAHTSTGDEISASFHLEEPPGTSVLILDWPQGPASIYPQVIAADDNVVLFELTCPNDCSPDLVSDYFIYQASRNDPSRRSSLSKLPVLYSKRDRNGGRCRRMQHIMCTDTTGVLSLGDDTFIVAELETRRGTVDIYLLVSERDKGKQRYGEWKVLKCLPVRNGDLLDLSCWSTDRVVPYRNHLVWVDYYKGMIFANMQDPWKEPNLRYVPLPVDATKGLCDDWNYGRRCPEAFRNIFITRSTIKFVTINRQHNSNSMDRCSSTFRITTWSFCKYVGTWVEEATLDAKEFWDLDSENCFPHVVPEFPVFNMRYPDAICFSLNGGSHTVGYSAEIWMVEIHMKKKLLLNVNRYPEEQYMSRQITTKSARVLSQGLSFIPSEIPYYLRKSSKLTKQEYN